MGHLLDSQVSLHVSVVSKRPLNERTWNTSYVKVCIFCADPLYLYVPR